MRLLHFLGQAKPSDLVSILGLALVAGLVNAILMLQIIKAAGLAGSGQKPGLAQIVLFLALFAIYYRCQKIAILRASRAIEELLAALRLRIAEKIRGADLQTIDRIGRSSLYLVVSRETNHLSVSCPLLVEAIQQVILVGMSLLGILHLSPPAFMLTILALLVGAVVSAALQRAYQRTAERLAEQQVRTLDLVEGFLRGSKELRLNRARSDDLFVDFQGSAHTTRRLLNQSGEIASWFLAVSGILMFGLVGIIAFVLPDHVEGHRELLLQLIPMILFSLAPLVKLMGEIPMFTQADVGLGAIAEVEDALDRSSAISPAMAREISHSYRSFQRIDYTQMVFHHRTTESSASFTVGPIDLTLTRGEVLFVVGGNGSGKSTFMRLVSGLYSPDEGGITVDAEILDDFGRQALGELFCAIFNDFHIFDALYGLEAVDPRQVRTLIEEMGLKGKVDFIDGHFSQIQLSTGQRKRLALIAALLEDRPIYILDEWSAEQDVIFRNQFYNEIIPRLKALGKTLIVVSHDERYFHVADRILKLDLGKMVWLKPS